jgi:zinc-binding alcohol dehydrogenase/oxidoreductase
MKALQLSAINQLAINEIPDPSPAPGEAVITLRAAALNHRDVWIKLGQYAGLKFPCIPGSDGAGVVSAVGAGADTSWLGREVLINPAFDWGESEHAQGGEFSILGLPRAGTLAEKIAVPAGQLSAKPAHLSWTEAAALPLTGLTAYRALFTRAQLKPGERLLLTGIGGGAALFALQFAVAHGAEVWVTSSSADKIARAVELGARGGFNYTEPGWAAAAKSSGFFNVIMDSAGGEGFEQLIDLAAPGGRVVFFGATRGNPPVLPMRKVFWRQLSLLGSTMGSPADWRAMTEFVALHHLKPIVSEVFSFEQGAAAFALMERGGQFGKIVVKISRF